MPPLLGLVRRAADGRKCAAATAAGPPAGGPWTLRSLFPTGLDGRFHRIDPGMVPCQVRPDFPWLRCARTQHGKERSTSTAQLPNVAQELVCGF
jgi:hypothetical protein